jgi:soluble lytic murein transglycosylase
MIAFLEALGPNERKHAQFVAMLRNFWLSDYMSPKEQATLLTKFGYLLTVKDHQQRIEMLLWRCKTETAMGLFSKIDATKRSVYQDWANLIQRKSKLSTSTHPGAAVVLAQNALRGNNESLAAQLLLQINPSRVFNMQAPYFATTIRTARELIEMKQYDVAIKVVATALKLAPLSSPHKVELHWLAGWILTAFLNKPSEGLHHFIEAASLAKASEEKAQYAYWAGKAATAANKQNVAKHWLEIAVQLPHTFYGQVAAKRLDTHISIKRLNLHQEEIQHFVAKDIVQAIQFLEAANEHIVKNVLLDALPESLKTGTDYALGFYLTQQYSTPYYTIHYYEKVNKVFNFSTPDVFLRIDFEPEHFSDIHFIHAMAFNESRFHPVIKSDMGALGLMQITPLTGRHLASKGHYFDEALLYKDPAYNLKMGSLYLKELFERFDQSYLLLAAAYNAGPTYISQWLKRVGRPKDDWDYEWIEHLAYKETRDYVKRLLGMRGLYERYSSDMAVYTPQELLQAYMNGCL